MPLCALCKSDKTNDIKYGEFLQKGNIAVHTFCLYFSSNLAQRGRTDDEGILGFLEPDIRTEERRISHLHCCYCNKAYANIGCCEKKCRRTFHLICGMQNGAENQFAKTFQSYCNRHIRKTSNARPSKEETCCICYDSVWDIADSDNEEGGVSGRAVNNTRKFNPIEMLQAPCCHNGWFHKYCLLKFARTSGYFFKCPLCNDKKNFCQKLPYKGIFIPSRDAAWEIEPNAFQELLQRPNTCSARPCNNRRGPEHCNSSNPLLTCTTCGSVAIHKYCMTERSQTFDCDECTSLLKSDSGHESLHSQNNAESVSDDDDDDMDRVIDVCNTDSEASEREQNNDADDHKMSIIELDSDGSDEKIPRTKGIANRKRRLVSSTDEDSRSNFGCCNSSRPSSQYDDGEENYDDDPLENFQVHMLRKLEQSQHNDSQIGHKTRQRSSTATERSGTKHQESTAHASKFIYDDDDEEMVPPNKRLQSRRIPDEETSSTSEASSETATDDSEDDPLENVNAYLNRRQGNNNLDISCIARRTRRRSHQTAGTQHASDNKGATRKPNRRATCHTIDDYTSNSSWNCEIVPKRKRRRTTHITPNTTEDDEEDSQVTRPANNYAGIDDSSNSSAREDAAHKNANILEISCIANRTRRKSTYSRSNRSDDVITDDSSSTDSAFTRPKEPSSSSEATEDCGEKNILDISCIAKRTRHKSSVSGSQKSDSSSATDKTSLIARTRRRQTSYMPTRLYDICEEASHKTPPRGSLPASRTTSASSSSNTGKVNSDNGNESDALKKPTLRQRRSLQSISAESESSSSFSSSSNGNYSAGTTGRTGTPYAKSRVAALNGKVIDTAGMGDGNNNINNNNCKQNQGKRKLCQQTNQIEDKRQEPLKNFSRSYGILVSRREPHRDL